MYGWWMVGLKERWKEGRKERGDQKAKEKRREMEIIVDWLAGVSE